MHGKGVVGELREGCLSVDKVPQSWGQQVKGGTSKARQGQAKRVREVKVRAR